MDVRIEKSWKAVLQEEFDKPYFKELTDFVKKEYHKKTVFPPPKDIFKAFLQALAAKVFPSSFTFLGVLGKSFKLNALIFEL